MRRRSGSSGGGPSRSGSMSPRIVLPSPGVCPRAASRLPWLCGGPPPDAGRPGPPDGSTSGPG
eukprot:8505252-Lingulodinium_polyedra.AAC.1